MITGHIPCWNPCNPTYRKLSSDIPNVNAIMLSHGKGQCSTCTLQRLVLTDWESWLVILETRIWTSIEHWMRMESHKEVQSSITATSLTNVYSIYHYLRNPKLVHGFPDPSALFSPHLWPVQSWLKVELLKLVWLIRAETEIKPHFYLLNLLLASMSTFKIMLLYKWKWLNPFVYKAREI